MTGARVLGALAGLLAALFAANTSGAQRPTVTDARYSAVVERLQARIGAEMKDKRLPALSIALVDGDTIVWAQGFGDADPAAKKQATAETVYRVGSVSKLFTDIGVMLLAERGEIDIDAPVTKYLPDFRPRNPFPGDPAITLRMLMSHRSGLVREPPVGNYFVTDEPSLTDTVRSINETELAYRPGERSKYSNIGVATVGYVLERVKGEPFAPYLEKSVLRPMGLNRSSFEKKPDLLKDLAKAFMWSYDGRWFEAPTFRFGMDPCGAMYSTVLDLGRFLSILFNRGRTPEGEVALRPETLEAMWKPQFAKAGEKHGFGLGFMVAEAAGHRWVGHDGAVYGFATTLQALPDDKLGVVAVTTKDGANSPVDEIAQYALRLMLARRDGKPLPEAPVRQPIDVETARKLAGRYRKGLEAVDLEERGGTLTLSKTGLDFRFELKREGDGFVTDDSNGSGMAVKADGRTVTVKGVSFARVPIPLPPPPPRRFEGLIGEYGFDHNTLFIYEKDGVLQALIEWFTSYPLIEVSRDVFRFPKWGLYDNETLRFTRDAKGRATQVVAANVTWPRRKTGPEDGSTFKIAPVRPVDELTKEALAATPPREDGDFAPTDLVDLTSLDPTIKLDIRYASSENFLGTPVYKQAKAFMQRPAAQALLQAHRALRKRGYGLLIHDAYRPWYVTKVFWDATPAEGKIFVADPAQGSRHNRGCAVDLTLYRIAGGKPVPMVSVYDEQSSRAFPDYAGGTSRQRWRRDLLRRAMEDSGFTVYEWEWWHFDYKDWKRYRVATETFEQLAPATK